MKDENGEGYGFLALKEQFEKALREKEQKEKNEKANLDQRGQGAPQGSQSGSSQAGDKHQGFGSDVTSDPKKV